MENGNRRSNVDNFLYYMLCKAMELDEGVLSGESVKKFFGCPSDDQLKAFLKTQKNLPYQESGTGRVIPKFTKHEIIFQLKKEYLKLRKNHPYLEPLDPAGVL